MATDAAITAALAAGVTLGVTLSDLRALILRAIAAGLTEDGRIVAATGSRGTSISFGSITEALEAVAKLDAMIAGSGFTSSPGEFVTG